MKKLVAVIEGQEKWKAVFLPESAEIFLPRTLCGEIVEKWRDFLRVEWWKDCGVETKNLWRNPWKIRQMPAAVSTACGNAFAQPSTGDSTAAEDASGKSLAAANFFLHIGFPQLVENGVENRKFSVEKRWKARIFKEIPRFHRKRQTEKAGEKKKALRNRFPIRLLQLSSTGAAFSGTRMRCVLSLLL